MNEQRDEQWLDDLLSQPATLQDKDFTLQVMGRVQQSKRQRRLILGGAWVIAAVITLLMMPWQQLVSTWQSLTTEIAATSTITSSATNSLQLMDFAQWALQGNVASLLLVGALSVVCLAQWFLQEN